MTNGRTRRGSTRPASEFSAANFALFAKGTTGLGLFRDTARRMATRSRYDWAHRFCVQCGLAATPALLKPGASRPPAARLHGRQRRSRGSARWRPSPEANAGVGATGEALILRFSNYFPSSIVDAAKRRLVLAGWHTP